MVSSFPTLPTLVEVARNVCVVDTFDPTSGGRLLVQWACEALFPIVAGQTESLHDAAGCWHRLVIVQSDTADLENTRQKNASAKLCVEMMP